MDNTLAPFERATPAELIEHVLRRYHEPLPGQMAALFQQIRTLGNQPGEPIDLLRELGRLLNDLWADLEPHLFKEERVLFPMIQSVAASAAAGGPIFPPPEHIQNGPIRVMKMEHERADEIQRALSEITSQYVPKEGSSAALRSLYEAIKTMDLELREHIRIEEEYLFPSVGRL